MKIEQIKLKNFRCFGAESAAVKLEDSVTALVGGNGSGKTALFYALSRLFGVTPGQRTVQQRDFHLATGQTELMDGAELFIECRFGFPELDDDEESDKGEKGDEDQGDEDEAQAHAVPDFFGHMAASGPGEPLKARIRLRATWNDDGTPDGTIEEELRWITTLDEAFEWEDCRNVSAVERASIQLVYVPAVRNPADRVTELLKGRLWKGLSC